MIEALIKILEAAIKAWSEQQREKREVERKIKGKRIMLYRDSGKGARKAQLKPLSDLIYYPEKKEAIFVAAINKKYCVRISDHTILIERDGKIVDGVSLPVKGKLKLKNKRYKNGVLQLVFDVV